MNEEWRPIPNTEGRLEVSNFGRIKSNLRDGRILKATPDKKGYLRIRVTLDRKKYSYRVHRVVAQVFIPNPKELPQVNHIDGNKANNCVQNLEWVSNKQNASHAIRQKLWVNVFKASHETNESRKIPVYSIDSVTGERLDFESVSEAERFFNSRHISDVLNGKRSKAAGQYFYRRR